MAGVKDRDLRQLGPWPLGINNIAEEGELPTDENGNRLALREADNLDLTTTGWPRSRPGQELVFVGELSHSLWSAKGLGFGLFVDDGELRVLQPDERTRRLGVTLSSHPVSFELINDRIYYSSRVQCGMLTLQLEHFAWAPQAPARQPQVAAVADGQMDAGRYQVAVTFRDQLGRESGTGLAAPLTVAEGQAIELTDIPQPSDALTTPLINIYCTRPNDPVLRLAAVVPAGTTSGLIDREARGPTLTTQFLAPMPPGQIVRYFMGRLLVASGRRVINSDPLHYGQYNPQRNVRIFTDEVTLLEPVGNDGFFVSAGYRTFWLSGIDPNAMNVRVARSTAAVPGSTRVPANVLGLESTEDVPVWLDVEGQFCVGLPGGAIKVLKDGEAVVDGAQRAALLFRKGNGLEQVIAALSGRQAQGLAVSDKPVVHILHDGSRA